MHQGPLRQHFLYLASCLRSLRCGSAGCVYLVFTDSAADIAWCRFDHIYRHFFVYVSGRIRSRHFSGIGLLTLAPASREHLPSRLRLAYYSDYIPLVATWDRGAAVKGHGESPPSRRC
jgi:hypothetical protein